MTAQAISEPLRVLLLEDDPAIAELTRLTVDRGDGPYQWSLVADGRAYSDALKQARFDIIVSDYNVPDMDGPRALALAKQTQPQAPFVLFSGYVDPALAEECEKAGAEAVVSKNRLSDLVALMRRLRLRAAQTTVGDLQPGT